MVVTFFVIFISSVTEASIWKARSGVEEKPLEGAWKSVSNTIALVKRVWSLR